MTAWTAWAGSPASSRRVERTATRETWRQEEGREIARGAGVGGEGWMGRGGKGSGEYGEGQKGGRGAQSEMAKAPCRPSSDRVAGKEGRDKRTADGMWMGEGTWRWRQQRAP